ncbi:Hypothetical protein PBC10988_27100 [Planctomycetales bacterium 10988]|nr:Hypothetical protein PBC10988_27100 [Planctomycetales bacterium 10988]
MANPLDLFKKKTKVAYSKFLERIIKDEKKRNGSLPDETGMKKIINTFKTVDKAVKLVEKDPKPTNLAKLRVYAQTAGVDISKYVSGLNSGTNPELIAAMKELKKNVEEMDSAVKALDSLAQHSSDPALAKKLLVKQKNLDAAVNMNIKRVSDFQNEIQKLSGKTPIDPKAVSQLATKLKKIQGDVKLASKEYLTIQADVRDAF